MLRRNWILLLTIPFLALLLTTPALCEEKPPEPVPVDTDEAAKSDDRLIAVLAQQSIPDLIQRVRQYKNRKRVTANLSDDELNSKFVSYSEKIIARCDTDGDSQLTPIEYSKMLMSPAQADTDQSGAISVTEYARWMLSRSQR